MPQGTDKGTLTTKKNRHKFTKSVSRKNRPRAVPHTEPADDVEIMLAAQMAATHEAAMECLRRSAIEDLSPELRDQNLKYGAKLLALYARQVELLDKHRLRRQEYQAREIEARENTEPDWVTSIETVLIDPDPRRFPDRVDDGHLATPQTTRNGAANGATHRAAGRKDRAHG